MSFRLSDIHIYIVLTYDGGVISPRSASVIFSLEEKPAIILQ